MADDLATLIPLPAAVAPSSATPAPAMPPASPVVASPVAASPVAASQVVVKKYANRRLYNTETSSYITLDNLADMIRAGRDFVVYDAKSGEDITRGVLTQIIVEEESKGGSMLPAAFLRQLIGFYGDSLQGVVPKYLEQAMANFARQQAQMRQVMQQTFSPFLPIGVPVGLPHSVEEIGRQNMALMERALSMFNPFHRAPDAPAGGVPAAKPDSPQPGTSAGVQPAAPQLAPPATAELDAMRHEIESLRAQLAIARAEAVMVHHVPPEAPPNLLAEPEPEPGLQPAPIDPSLAAALQATPSRRSRNGRKPG